MAVSRGPLKREQVDTVLASMMEEGLAAQVEGKFGVADGDRVRRFAVARPPAKVTPFTEDCVCTACEEPEGPWMVEVVSSSGYDASVLCTACLKAAFRYAGLDLTITES